LSFLLFFLSCVWAEGRGSRELVPPRSADDTVIVWRRLSFFYHLRVSRIFCFLLLLCLVPWFTPLRERILLFSANLPAVVPVYPRRRGWRNVSLNEQRYVFLTLVLRLSSTTVRLSNFDRWDQKMGGFLQSTEATPLRTSS
jgi:hypothetical protein